MRVWAGRPGPYANFSAAVIVRFPYTAALAGMSPKNPSQRIKQLFLEFVRSLAPEDGPSERHSDVPSLTFYQEDLGGLSLWGDSAARHRTTIEKLLAALPENKDWSQRDVEKLFERAVLATLDIREREPQTTDKERSQREADVLAEALLCPPTPQELLIPVVGFSVKHLPRRFGGIRFSAATPATLKRFLSSKGSRLWSDHFERDLPAEFAVGRLTVRANTPSAAASKARRAVALALDVLNFFADLLHPRDWKVRVALVEEFPEHHPLVVSFDAGKQTTHVNFAANEFLFPLELPKSTEPLARHLGLARCDKFLAATPTEHERRLLAAVAWAGRATVEPRREVAFLHYAIALETLVIARKVTDSLVREVAVRTALLAHKEPSRRVSAFDDVRRLYDIRSKIAHSGSLQVTDADLSDMRWYAKQATVFVLTMAEMKDVQTNADFEAWIAQNLLGHRWARARRGTVRGQEGPKP
mgnify:CR=1 FL=1